MRVLLVGSGGREHAIAWKLVSSPRLERLYIAPGNGAALPKTETVDLRAADIDALLSFARAEQIDLTVVGPEQPLVEGIVDAFQAAGLRIFGPTRAAARMEGSKAFSKAFMLRHAIPTGAAAVFTDFDEAMRHLRQLDEPPVVKASGLASGKGVLLPETMTGAAGVVQQMMLEERFGAAGSTVILEERLTGPELSVLAFCAGEALLLMPAAQDHKRLLDGDYGPNTGGMGAFAPSPLATPELLVQVEAEVMRPALRGLAAEGMPYTGVLYAGLMLTPDGPKVLEFNCRFGDPEAQAILPLLESDLLEIFEACVDGRLAEIQPVWQPGAAVTVVMAARGYPTEPESGQQITHIEAAEQAGCLVFHARTKMHEGRLVSAGGRVLAVTGRGETLAQARRKAYRGVEKVKFNGAQFRRDIAAAYR